MGKLNLNRDNENERNTEKKSKEGLSTWIIPIAIALFIRIFVFAPTVVVGHSMMPTLQDPIEYTRADNDRLIAERVSYFLNIKPSRGDIVTFTEPSSPFYIEQDPIKKIKYFFTKRDYIKRVIGVEGDHVQIKGKEINVGGEIYKNYELKDGRFFINGVSLTGRQSVIIKNASVYINGKRLKEDYVKEPWDAVVLLEEDGRISPYGPDVNIDVVVPKGYIYVLGDNRNYSKDSRKFSQAKNDYKAKDGCISLKELSGRIIFRFWPLDRIGTVK